MVIFKGFLKEVVFCTIVITLLLLVIFLSNVLVRYLNQVALGWYPITFIAQLILLEIPYLCGFLLPLGYFVSLLLILGRMHEQNEMIVLASTGYRRSTLLSYVLISAIIIGFFVAILVFWITPEVLQQRSELRNKAEQSTIVDMLIPGQFRVISQNKIIYTETLSADRSEAQKVFFADYEKNENTAPSFKIMTAAKAYSKIVNEKVKYIVLEKGGRYMGVPGTQNFVVVSFDKFAMKIISDGLNEISSTRVMSLKKLWNLENRALAHYELQWRASIPISMFVLSLLAFSLYRLKPSQSRYSKIFPGAIIYLLYANMIIVARYCIKVEIIPIWIGVWWVHLLWVFIGTYLYKKYIPKK